MSASGLYCCHVSSPRSQSHKPRGVRGCPAHTGGRRKLRQEAQSWCADGGIYLVLFVWVVCVCVVVIAVLPRTKMWKRAHICWDTARSGGIPTYFWELN